MIALDAELEGRRFEVEKVREKNRAEMSEIEDAIQRRQIATANTKDAARLFLENLPGLLAGAKIENVNLGDPALVGAITRLAGSLKSPRRSGGRYVSADE